MNAIFIKLRASTLVEMLVTMLVAGIVMASVMDGLALFFRVQLRQTQLQYEAVRLSAGFDDLRAAVAASDSLRSAASGGVTIYRHGASTHLRLCDSSLLFESDLRSDTILSGLSLLQLDEYTGTDTLTVVFANGFTAKIPVRDNTRQYYEQLAEIENGYGDET